MRGSHISFGMATSRKTRGGVNPAISRTQGICSCYRRHGVVNGLARVTHGDWIAGAWLDPTNTNGRTRARVWRGDGIEPGSNRRRSLDTKKPRDDTYRGARPCERIGSVFEESSFHIFRVDPNWFRPNWFPNRYPNFARLWFGKRGNHTRDAKIPEPIPIFNPMFCHFRLHVLKGLGARPFPRPFVVTSRRQPLPIPLPRPFAWRAFLPPCVPLRPLRPLQAPTAIRHFARR